MADSPVAVELEAGECEAEAEEAIWLLNGYNEVLAQALDPINLATPSPASCRWCHYQLYCPAFWGAVAPGWKDGLLSAAIAGSATGPANPIHGGSALSLSLHDLTSSSSGFSLFPPGTKRPGQVRAR